MWATKVLTKRVIPHKSRDVGQSEACPGRVLPQVGGIQHRRVLAGADRPGYQMQKTIDFMVRHAPYQRDQIILLLLRQTGARLIEIVELTVGGYRNARRAGRALVKNKGSRGREEKMIYFTPTVERYLLRYVQTERAQHDPQGRKRLEELHDRDPLFLTRTGKPYTKSAFYYHWNKLFTSAQRQFEQRQQVAFTPHDLRHLRVTRGVTAIRKTAQDDGLLEAELLEGFQHLMGWRSPETMAAYTKTMNKRKALEAVLADMEKQEQWDGGGQTTALQGSAPTLPSAKSRHQQSDRQEPSLGDDEFRWYESDG